MNAKELIEAANAYRRKIETTPKHVWLTETDSLAKIMADHILSTVRPDDDEPVTRERLEADGWYYDGDNDWFRHPDHLMHFTAGPQYRNVLWFCVGSIVKTVASMGHLRRLVAALGE